LTLPADHSPHRAGRAKTLRRTLKPRHQRRRQPIQRGRVRRRLSPCSWANPGQSSWDTDRGARESAEAATWHKAVWEWVFAEGARARRRRQSGAGGWRQRGEILGGEGRGRKGRRRRGRRNRGDALLLAQSRLQK